MKGIFINRLRGIPIGAFMVIAGIIIGIQAAVWGVEEFSSLRIASGIFCIGFVVFGLSFAALGLLTINLNNGSRFEICDSAVIIKNGWTKEYSIPLGEISDVKVQAHHLKLITAKRNIWIYRLENAAELGKFLFARIVRQDEEINLDEEHTRCKACRKKYVRYVTALICSLVMMFIHIGWCTILTDGKDLGDFSYKQEIIFLIFTFAELLTLSVTFLLCRYAAKSLSNYERSKNKINSYLAKEHRRCGTENYDRIIDVKYFDGGMYRIIIFSVLDNAFAYMLEKFNPKEKLWVRCYEHPRLFESLEDLYADLSITFADVIFDN